MLDVLYERWLGLEPKKLESSNFDQLTLPFPVLKEVHEVRGRDSHPLTFQHYIVHAENFLHMTKNPEKHEFQSHEASLFIFMKNAWMLGACCPTFALL